MEGGVRSQQHKNKKKKKGKHKKKAATNKGGKGGNCWTTLISLLCFVPLSLQSSLSPPYVNLFFLIRGKAQIPF